MRGEIRAIPNYGTEIRAILARLDGISRGAQGPEQTEAEQARGSQKKRYT